MIIADDWIWIHFPKCGGTTTEKILRKAFGASEAVMFDDITNKQNVIWHDTIPGRFERDPAFSVTGKKVFSNIRRLPTWLLSRVHFETARTGGNALIDRERFAKGFFNFPYKAQETGRWASRIASCDSVMTRFSKGVTDWIRLENLADDISGAFGSEVRAGAGRENTGTIDYIRDLNFWFTPTEMEDLYRHNPVWA
jgi:hypothetical protein